MNSANMASLIPSPDDLLKLPIERQGSLLLQSLKGYDRPEKTINLGNFFNRMADYQYPPKYGDKQRDVDTALMEAWGWLENQGYLTKAPTPGSSGWVFISNAGKHLLAQTEINDLLEEPDQGRREPAWWGRAESVVERWNPAKSPEAKAAKDTFFEHFNAIRQGADKRRQGEKQMLALLNQAKHEGAHAGRGSVPQTTLTLIAESRLDELRALRSAQFDFRKLIRLCEELNIAAREDCLLAVGMLTRALLDHVPPVFGVRSFSEVANNYIGGSKSFKETMLHLDTAAKKIADGLLHTQIRPKETLPAQQQVNFGPQLDLLLAEIVRIT